MSALNVARTGVPGLDDILNGGLTSGRLFVMEGSPGTGKTTMAMRFLMEGAAQGERTLYVTLSESEEELRATAEGYGWSFGDTVKIFELAPPESLLDADQQQSLLYSSDLELSETTKLIFDAVEQSKATRIVLDSMSEIRLLAQSSLRYRRQVLALKHYFGRRGATVRNSACSSIGPSRWATISRRSWTAASSVSPGSTPPNCRPASFPPVCAPAWNWRMRRPSSSTV